MLKEELTKENGRLQSRVFALEREDELNRKELSSILGSYEMRSEFGYSPQKKEVKTLSWFEISAQIGRLLEKRDYLGLLSGLEDVRAHLRTIDDDIRRQNKDNQA